MYFVSALFNAPNPEPVSTFSMFFPDRTSGAAGPRPDFTSPVLGIHAAALFTAPLFNSTSLQPPHHPTPALPARFSVGAALALRDGCTQVPAAAMLGGFSLFPFGVLLPSRRVGKRGRCESCTYCRWLHKR